MELCADNVSKHIKKSPILKHITMHLKGSLIVGLMGPNGSGKTMLLRAFCGLIHPDEGTITIDGKALGKDMSFPPSVGILIENPSFISKYTGFINLKMLASIKGIIKDEDIKDALTKVGLDPNDPRSFRKYSLGMKQRLGIAAALMEGPDLILIDEPFNALDPEGITAVRTLLLEHKAQGALLVVACHDKEEMDLLADEVYVLAEGRVVNHYERA